MADPELRHEIGKIVLPKRKKNSRPLPRRVRAMLEPTDEAYEALSDDEEDANEDLLENDETELITFDFGDHDYYAPPTLINFNDHSYCG